MATVYAVIMAGGRGERFWPLSTGRLTKPFIALLGAKTLIQETVERLEPLVPLQRILVSIGEDHLEVARQQLPQIPLDNFIAEPVGRDTSACLGLCSLHLERRDPDSVMLAIPADHVLNDPTGFRRTLQKGFDNLEGATGVVFGVKPDRPETGYGYIRAKRPEDSSDAWPVISFVEKPDAASAALYVKSDDYFWNSGMFLWQNRTLLELFRTHMPEAYRRLIDIRSLLGRSDTQKDLRQIFSELPRISVDFGIVQKTSGLRMIPAEFGWDDIGHWTALERVLPADSYGNVGQGAHVAVNSSGCILYSDVGVVATFGVSDMVVVQANGKVLVCPKDRAADLKRLVTALGPEAE